MSFRRLLPHTPQTHKTWTISQQPFIFLLGGCFSIFCLLYFIWFLSRSCGSFSSFVQLNSCSLSSFIYVKKKKKDAEEDVKTKFSFSLHISPLPDGAISSVGFLIFQGRGSCWPCDNWIESSDIRSRKT